MSPSFLVDLSEIQGELAINKGLELTKEGLLQSKGNERYRKVGLVIASKGRGKC
jgi:hypothetical protein